MKLGSRLNRIIKGIDKNNETRLYDGLIRKGFEHWEARTLARNLIDILYAQKEVLRLLEENNKIMAKPKHERVLNLLNRSKASQCGTKISC